jgi:uncharacterized protein YeaO (DUF488 family)
MPFGALQVFALAQGASCPNAAFWLAEASRRNTMHDAISPERIRLKRAYEPPAAGDGTRVLVDRLWPRGVKKAAAAVDIWAKDIAPSTGLRQWFGHQTDRWDEFCRRYAAELEEKTELVNELRALARSGPITLVFGAHDQTHNDAVVLRKVLLNTAMSCACKEREPRR